MAAPLVGRQAEVSTLEQVVARGGTAVITGEAGIGKTAICRVVADRARERRWAVEYLVGTVAARSLMFGAAARLLPEADDADTQLLLLGAVRRIRERAATAPLMLVVDDAQLLDAASATLVHHLVLDGAARCLLIVRSGETCPDQIVGLWKDGHARRIDLEPLDRAHASQLLGSTLGGVIGTLLDAEMWRLARGNPLFLRELVAAARADGALVEADGVWTLRGRLPPSDRLADVIDARLRALEPGDRAAIEVIAVGEPLPLAMARTAVGSDQLQRLETRKLILVDTVTGLVHAAHPMYGEVLRATMPVTRRAALAADLADALTGAETSDRDGARFAAALLLQAGRAPPADLALEGARAAQAVSDVHLAERLARCAIDDDPVTANLILGRALRLQERSDEAETVLAGAAAAARTDQQIAEVALARARTRLWANQDLDAARALLDTARTEVGDRGWKATIEAELALQLARFGDMSEGADVADRALERPTITPRAELAALIVSTLRRALTLAPDGLDDALDRGLQLADELRDDEPLATEQLLLTRVTQLFYTDVRAAGRLADEWSDVGSPLRGAWRMAAAMACLLVGDPVSAVVAAHEAQTAMEQTDPFGNLAMTRAIHALALAQAGDHGSPATRPASLDEPDVQREPRATVWAERARAWQAVAAGDLDRAVDLAATGGAAAIAAGYAGWGSDLLHDAVRLGAADRVVTPLIHATSHGGFPVAELFGLHAAALAGPDPSDLGGVAAGFEEAGTPLFAAEVHAQLAALHDRRRNPTAAARAAVRAQVLAEACSGRTTPALASIEVIGLTVRQLHLARQAAAGRSNPEIAADLTLSRRTVENHLARVYRKLGVGGREELHEILG